MRDLILLAALIGIVPLTLRAPIVGVLAWLWVSLTTPQRAAYTFLHDFQLNTCIAVLTAAAWALSKERKTIPLSPFTVFLILFALWTCLATYLALDRAHSLPLWDRTIKTIILALAIVTVANTKARIQAVIWTWVVSLGYYAVKGGGFVLLTGGRQHVFGPDDTMIGDNNELGLALIVLLPMVNYLRLTSRLRSVRLACLGVIGLTILAIVGTYSRGALLTLAAAAAAYAVRSRFGLILVLPAAVLALSAPSFLPSNWLDRMSTIQSYSQDASFEGRREAWKTSVNIAMARPLTGGGFASVEVNQVARQFQSPGSLKSGRAAHSIYFEVLGDTGFVGLGLYLLMIAAAGANTWLVLATTRARPDLAWANQLARMFQVSMVAMLVGGAALSMAYYDGFIVLLALTSSLLLVVRASAPETAASTVKPRWRELATIRSGRSGAATIEP